MIIVISKLFYTVGFIMLLLTASTTEETPLSFVCGLAVLGILFLCVGYLLHLLPEYLKRRQKKACSLEYRNSTREKRQYNKIA